MNVLPGGAAEHLYEKVKNDIKAGIYNHTFEPNTRIPSEAEMMEIYNVSRITVRRAIEELVEEGYLIKRHGTGTFVNPPKHSRHVVGVNSFTADCLNSGITPRTEVIFRGFIKATEADARALGVQQGDRVVYIERVRYADEEPAIIEKTCFSEDFSALLEEGREGLQSIARLLESKFHVQIASLDMTIELSFASKHEADLLRISPNSPVMIVNGKCMDEKFHPIYRSKQIIAGDKFKIAATQSFLNNAMK